MLTSSVKSLFIFIHFAHFRVLKKKKNNNFWLIILICYKRDVIKCNGHKYVVLKYVVEKQIICKNDITSVKRFLFYLPRKVII